ncbi:MAG TPA: hypothetical protein VG276_02915 [Actinomycetes bacterium]|jgi:hypothetical protein|nr:hypothetical protein [Actinomycetes bacterium]
MTVDGQPPMVDEQAVLVFLRQLDRALSSALHADEQQRLHRLTLTQTLVLAVLADPRRLDQALRHAAADLATWIPDRSRLPRRLPPAGVLSGRSGSSSPPKAARAEGPPKALLRRFREGGSGVPAVKGAVSRPGPADAPPGGPGLRIGQPRPAACLLAGGRSAGFLPRRTANEGEASATGS